MPATSCSGGPPDRPPQRIIHLIRSHPAIAEGIFMSYHLRRHLLFGALALPLCAAAASAQRRGAPNPDRPVRAERFEFDFLGPASGGRTASVSGVPGDTTTWYLGSASGGVWKSTDGGHNFTPIFDSMSVQAIGALAVAPSNHNIVWAGTGEAWAIRDADIIGDGIYKSTDAGKTWTHMGLTQTGRIGEIIVDPTNADIVYTCALGRTTGKQQERGVFKTTDGGKTWKRVLFVDENTGCSALSMSPKMPNVLLAGMWQVEMHPWIENSGGASSSVWISRDGGDSWSRVKDASFPKPPIGKVGVAISPSDPNRMYALLETHDQGSLWRSDDGGKAWRNVSWMRTLIGRAGYYMGISVNPGNPDEVVVANSSVWRSLDGGKTFKSERWGGDSHDIWMDPTDPDHFAITDDGGARLTTDHGKTITGVAIANAQMYHVAVDTQIPYWVYGNRQDNGTFRGPSDGPESGGRGGFRRGGRRGGDGAAPGYRAPTHEWEHGLGGCESGFTLPDLNDPNIVWASCYGNKVSRYNSELKLARDVSPWVISLDSPPTDAKYRCHWTPPLAIDPFDSKTVYYGCQVVFKTSNGGQSWDVISPDLSTRDPSRIVFSGGVNGDNLGQFYGEVVFAIAPSDVQQGLIWAGTNDGQLWVTKNGGGDWTNVTKNIHGVAEWGSVRKIQPSHFDAATAYVAIDRHLMDDSKPYIFKTTDFGQTWTKVTGDLPAEHPLDYVMAVTENPNRKGMLFAGTGHGFYYSMDDGAHWTHFKAGLPAAPVSWIVVSKRFHDVVASTYGRGIWVLRDITVLEQSDKGAETTATTLFAPHPAYRQARSGRADFTFALPSAARVKLDILDPNGTKVRTINVAAHDGLNRVSWDLRYDNAKQVALRTVAPDNPYIWNEPRFAGDSTRPVIHWGIGQPLGTPPIAAPGRYTVRLTAAGKQYEQPFDILKDPQVPSPSADLVASTDMQLRIRNDMTETAEMINRLEVMRKRLEDQTKASAGKSDALRAIREMEKKIMDVELQLISRSTLQGDDKWYVEAYKVYLNLVWLYGAVGSGAGDVAGGAEYRPTDTQVQVLHLIEQDLEKAKADYKTLMERDVTAFNRKMPGVLNAVSDN
jgi:photosystem II stability/assembly factor-like uncharacterized protein